MAKEFVEFVRDSLSGEEKGIEEVLLLQALTGSQSGGTPMDPTTLLLLMAMSGRKSGRRFENLALIATLMQQQQAQAQAATCSSTGVPMPAPATNPLMAVLALGLLDRPRVEVTRFPGGSGSSSGKVQALLAEISGKLDQLGGQIGKAMEEEEESSE
jgi:hypothetical protein